MMRIAIAILIVAGTISFNPTISIAWDDPPEGTTVLMTASCAEENVILSIDFTVIQPPPTQFVGWVVQRQVIGLCIEDAWVTEVMPWPLTGQSHYSLTITPDTGFFDAIYRIWAVDADGNETFIYWPQRHNFAHAECLPGPTVVGEFVEYGGYVHFEACSDFCWPSLSFFDGTYPDGAEELAGTGQLMNLYGELISGMEGIFIRSTSMEPSSYPCEAVGTSGISWGGLKAKYR